MKWKLRSFLSLFTAISFISLCSCIPNYSNEEDNQVSALQTTITAQTLPPKTEVTTITSPTESVTSFTQTNLVETTETESELEIETPIHFQSNIELCTFEKDFFISSSYLDQLKDVTSSYPGSNIAWGLYSLKDDDYIAYQKDTEFTSCSTIKVVYALYCLEQVKQGKASLDDILTYSWKKHHYQSATASSSTIAKLGQSEFTLKEVIYYALYISDNDAYLMLQDYFGFDGFNEYMDTLGSSTNINSSMRFGHATVNNRAIEWKQIYSFYNEDTEAAKFLKKTLIDAQYGYIEEGLDFETAHKSGWSNKYGAAHDCAVVYSPNGEYLMIILTQKWNSYPQKQLVKELAPILNGIWDEYTQTKETPD